MSKYYLRIEAVNFDNFVYDSKNLSTIRGGGLLLLNAIDLIAQIDSLQLIGLKVLIAGASIGFYEFEADETSKAEEIRCTIYNFLHTHSQLKHSTFVIDILLATEEAKFNTDHEMLLAKNRWRQMQSPSIAIPAQNCNRSVEACVIDGVRPALSNITVAENNILSVSPSVAQRHDYGRDQKQKFYKEHSSSPIKGLFTHHLNELTHAPEQGNLHHKMAVIYLDGNEFGKKKKANGGGLKRHKLFAQTLKEYRKQMLTELLTRVDTDKLWKTQEDKYRLEVLLWGGDEMIFVVPAWLGWKALSFFFEQSKNWKFQDDSLYHAGGMVLCHYNAPIHRITQLAKDLAELAKEKDRTKNLFAYEVLESFDYIGRNLASYRYERSPQPLVIGKEPCPQNLILSANEMNSVSSYTPLIKQKISKRKLHKLVRNLLTKTPLTDEEINKYSKERNTLIQDLRKDLNDSTLQNALSQIISGLGGEEVGWLHLCILWDYLI